MTPRPSVPAEYKGLHKYLRERFAQTVVLTFAEIEDLMGGTLPSGSPPTSNSRPHFLTLIWWNI